MTEYIDITPTINEKIAVFPGDTTFTRQVDLTISDDCPVHLSHITTTLHLGAHTDAPNHYDTSGSDIADRDLDYYIGDCQVIHLPVSQPNSLVQLSDLANIQITAPRVLFYTNSFPDPYQWRDDFCAICPTVIENLAHQGVKLIGIDTPSIDPADSKQLLAHQQVKKHNMAILEGVILNSVPAGNYQLIALPLKIQGADASPVRAVLYSNS